MEKERQAVKKVKSLSAKLRAEQDEVCVCVCVSLVCLNAHIPMTHHCYTVW